MDHRQMSERKVHDMKAIGIVVLSVWLIAALAWIERATLAAQSLDISKMTCKELMAGNDADRDAGLGYFHGFVAGRKNNQVIDLKAMTELSDKVKDFCLSNPTSTVLDAFAKSGG